MNINEIFAKAISKDLERVEQEIIKNAEKGQKPAIVHDLYNNHTRKALEAKGYKIDENFSDKTVWYIDWPQEQEIDSYVVKPKMLKQP